MDRQDESCCLPGDITITQVFSGWLLGNALEQIGPGPWWSFIAIFPDFQSALKDARVLAREKGVRVWFHEGGMKYREIPLDDSPYAPPTG
jgi:hypothetical protein